MLTVSVTKLYLNKKVKTNWLRQVVKEILKYEGISTGEVSIVLGDDELLKRLNKEYRGVDKPTDVLAFGFSKAKTLHSKTSVLEYKPLSLSNLLGEIIISLDAVRRQAKEYKHSFEKELTILLIHGVLHILGYDHSDDNLPQEPMAIRTNKILEKITDRIIYDAGVK